MAPLHRWPLSSPVATSITPGSLTPRTAGPLDAVLNCLLHDPEFLYLRKRPKATEKEAAPPLIKRRRLLANPFPEFKVRVKQEPTVDTLTVAEKSAAACSEDGESVKDALSFPSVEDAEVPPVPEEKADDVKLEPKVPPVPEEKADDVKLEPKVDIKVESSMVGEPKAAEAHPAHPTTPAPSAAVVSVASSPVRAAGSDAEVTPSAAKELSTVPQIFFPPAVQALPPPPIFGIPKSLAFQGPPEPTDAEPPEIPSGEVSPMSAPADHQELDSWAADQANLFLQSMFTVQEGQGDLSPAPPSRAEDAAVVPVSEEDEAEEEPEVEHEDEELEGKADEEEVEPEAEDGPGPDAWPSRFMPVQMPEGPPPGDWEEPLEEEDQAEYDEGEGEEEEDEEDDPEEVENDTTSVARTGTRRATLSAVKEPLEPPPGNFNWNVWTNPFLARGSHDEDTRDEASPAMPEAAVEVSRGSKGAQGTKGSKGKKGNKGTKATKGKGTANKGQSEGKGWTAGWNTWKATKASKKATNDELWENDPWSQEIESTWKSDKEWKSNASAASDNWKAEKEWKTQKEWNSGEDWKAKEWKGSSSAKDWSNASGTTEWNEEKEWKTPKWEWKPKVSSSKSENENSWSTWKKWPEEQQNQSSWSWGSRSRGNAEAW